MAYRVYYAPDGSDEAYCGERDTYVEAVALAETEPDGLERSMWETARAAGHVGGLTAPDGGIEGQPISWHGSEGWHCVVEVGYMDVE